MDFSSDPPDEYDSLGGEVMSEDDTAQPAEGVHQKLMRWSDPRQTVNIADEIEPELLAAIGMRVVREFEIDNGTRSKWMEQTTKAIELAMQESKQKDYPWPKAANVIFPLMTTAANQFAARAYPAIVSGRNVVKGVVIGPDDGLGRPMPDGQIEWALKPGAKQAQADKLGEHMSWQLLEEQPEWEPETDQLLHILPIVGCVFRKSYFDSGKGRNCSHMVPAQNLVISYYAKSLELAPRVTEIVSLYPREIKERELSGVFLPNDYGMAPETDGDVDAPHDFLEQHRYLDLDDDGYSEPYIVTVHKQSQKVARIVARYDADSVTVKPDGKIVRIDPVIYYTKYDFLPNPDGGIYGIGFGQLLKPINEAVNSTLNQLLDAGHLANTAGGFIGKGLSMHAGTLRFSLGEFKTVNANGATIKDNIVPMTFPGPSPVLFNLLGLLIDAGKEIASIKDILTGDVKSQTMQPTTALAMIEQGLKVFTAIYKRIHRALKSELGKLYRLNRVYMNAESQYKIGDEWKTITQADYQKGSGVEPVSDPSMVSDMQRMGRAQFLMGFIGNPLVEQKEVLTRVFTAANFEHVDNLIVQNPTPPPDVTAKGLELELKDREVTSKEKLDRSTELKNIAQAVQALSSAATAAVTADANADIAWMTMQLDMLRMRLEAANGSDGKPAQGQGAGAGIPGVEAPPDDGALPPIPPGLPPSPDPGGSGPMGGGNAPHLA